MAISRTQAVSATANNVAISSTSNGDLILVWAYFAGTATIPTLPGGFTSIVGTAGTAQAARLGYKVSTGGDTSSGTWTNATQVVCHVYNGTYASAVAFGTTPTITAGNSAILTYSALTLQNVTGTSWVVAFGGAASATAGMGGTPTGTAPNLSNRTSQTKANGLDTGTGITANFSVQTLTVTTSGRWQTVRIELKAPSVSTQGFTSGLFGITGIGTQTVSDSFNRADESPIAGNWTPSTYSGSRFVITGNTAQVDVLSNDCSAYWTSWASGNDQYSQVKVTSTETIAGAGVGVVVRHVASASTMTMYRLVLNSDGEYELLRLNTGTGTTLGTGSMTYSVGRLIGLSVQGSTLKIWNNGVQVGSEIVDGSPITSGNPGLAFSSGSGGITTILDDWDAGTVGGSTPSTTFTHRTGKTLLATTSFAGNIARKTFHLLTSTLSFISVLVTNLIHSGGLHFQSLTASLSFVGGTVKGVVRGLNAVVSFVGARTNKTIKTFVATLTFIGLRTTVNALGQVLSASLSFAGSLNRRTSRIVTSSLSFIGLFGRRYPKLLVATLSSTGTIGRGYVKSFFATLFQQ